MPTSAVHFPPAYLLAFHILFYFALSSNSALVRRVSFPPLAAILIHLLVNTSTSHLTQDWLTGHMLVIELLTASDYLLVTADLHTDLRELGAGPSISDAPFSERLKWALKLTLNPRGIRWLHEPIAALPPRPTATRSTFLVSQALRLAFYAALLFAVGQANNYIPALHKGSPGLGSNGWLQQLISVFLVGMSLYTTACVRGCIFRLLFVGFGSWDPPDCPDLFDSWRHAYTVRKFWGKFWHQILRRLLLSHSRLLAHRVMGLQPGSTMSAYVQLFAAFFLSGMIHYVGQYMLLRDYPHPLPKGPIIFFLAQAAVITLEDIAVAAGKELGLKSRVWKVVGHVWVLTWFTLSVPVWMDPQIAAGFMDLKSRGGMTLKFAALGDLYIDM